jgi:hypothetical protein
MDLHRETVECVKPGNESRFGKISSKVEWRFSRDVLGNGSRITSPDTVPFALWCAARHLDDYAEALWTAASAGGDNDTNCAIVGGIVGSANGVAGIPRAWLAAREPLDWPYSIVIKDSLASADRGEGCNADEFFEEPKRELRISRDP